jgi:hypothetical protein
LAAKPAAVSGSVVGAAHNRSVEATSTSWPHMASCSFFALCGQLVAAPHLYVMRQDSMREFRWNVVRSASPSMAVKIPAQDQRLSLHRYRSASKVHRCCRNASSRLSPGFGCCINSSPSLSRLVAASCFAPGSVATAGQPNRRAPAVVEPRCIAKVRCGQPLPPSVPCSRAPRSLAA